MMMVSREQNTWQTTLDGQQQPTPRVTGQESALLSFQVLLAKNRPLFIQPCLFFIYGPFPPGTVPTPETAAPAGHMRAQR